MLNIKVNGNFMAYERHGKGSPLVLLHGYPFDHSTWEPLVALLEDNFDLILPDLRGFGESEIVGTNFTMAAYAADIADLLDQLQIQKAAITGHSMGGYAALAFASTYPGRVLGLGLVSSQTLADAPDRKTARLQDAENILKNGVKDTAEAMPVKLTENPGLQLWLKELILRQRPEALAGALRAMADRPDSTPKLSGFDFPIVLVHGLADALIPVKQARSVKMVVPGAYLTEIPAVGHMPMMEAPEATAQALKKLSTQ